MLKLRTEDTALTSRPVNSSESGNILVGYFLLLRKAVVLDAISINSDNVTQSATVTNVQSNRQRNPSVSSSCPSVNQELTPRPKG